VKQKAAITIQAAERGRQKKKWISRWKEEEKGRMLAMQGGKALLIQRVLRGYFGRKLFLARKNKKNEEGEVLCKNGLTLREVILVLKVQAKVRGYLARKRYMKLINEEGAVNQIFRYDMSVRRLVYGNQHKLFSMYKQYIVFPAQALDRKGMMQIAQDFDLLPTLCNRREVNDAVDEVSKRNKNFTPGGAVLLSFEQFLKFLIYVSLKFVKTAPYDEAVYKFNTMLAIMDSSQGHSKVTNSRYTTFVQRFVLFDSGNLPSPAQLRNIDLAKIVKPKKLAPTGKSKSGPESSQSPRYERSDSMSSDASSVSLKRTSSSQETLQQKGSGSTRSRPKIAERTLSMTSDNMSISNDVAEETDAQQCADDVLRCTTPQTSEKSSAPTSVKNISSRKK